MDGVSAKQFISDDDDASTYDGNKQIYKVLWLILHAWRELKLYKRWGTWLFLKIYENIFLWIQRFIYK